MPAAAARAAQVYLSECAALQADVGGKQSALEDKLAYERAKAAEIEASRADAEARAKEAASAHAKLAKKAEKSKAEFGAFERRDIEAREQLKSLKAQAKKAKGALEKEAKRAHELDAAATRADEDTARLSAEAETHRATVADAEAKVAKTYESLAGEVAPLRAKLDGLQAARAPHAAAASQLEAAAHELEAEAELLRTKARAGAARAEKAAEAAARAATARDAKRAAASEAAKAAVAAALADKAAAAALDAAADALALASAERAAALGRLEEARAAVAATRGASGVVSALLAAHAAGELPGVFGRLGGLGAIDPKYDVAISTACGALDHIVVADADAAQKCVALLRARQLGVATFIMLDKMGARAAAAAAPFAPPPGALRLFDLVTPADARFGPAFFHALGDTLVCESLEAASATAFGGAGGARFRTVSLQGHLVDTSGAMSGGGGAVAKGRLALGVGAAAAALGKKGKGGGAAEGGAGDGASGATSLAALERATADADAALDGAKAALGAAKDARVAAARGVRELGLEAKKAEAAAASADSQAADAERQRAAAEADKGAIGLSAAEAARLAQLGADAEGAAARLQAASATLAAADVKIGAVQAQLDAAGGTAFKLLKVRLADALAALADASQGAARAGLQAEAARAAAAKSDGAQAKARADADRLAEQADAVARSLAVLEDEAAGCLDTLRDAQAKEEEARGAAAEAREAVEASDAIVAKVRSVEVDILGQLDEFKRSLKEAETKARHWGAKLGALKEQLAQLGREFGAELARQAAGEAGVDEDDVEVRAAAAAGVAAGGAHGMNVCELVELDDDELGAIDRNALQREIACAEEALARLAPNMAAIADFQTKEREWLSRLGEFDATCAARDAARAELDTLKRARLEEFMAGFNVISLKLKEMYQMITLGGDAELELVDSLDPFAEVRGGGEAGERAGGSWGGVQPHVALAVISGRTRRH